MPNDVVSREVVVFEKWLKKTALCAITLIIILLYKWVDAGYKVLDKECMRYYLDWGENINVPLRKQNLDHDLKM